MELFVRGVIQDELQARVDTAVTSLLPQIYGGTGSLITTGVAVVNSLIPHGVGSDLDQIVVVSTLSRWNISVLSWDTTNILLEAREIDNDAGHGGTHVDFLWIARIAPT